MTKKQTVTKKSWEQFRETGLLWFVNRVLHLFGWAIVVNIDIESNKVLDVYPARVLFRGFDHGIEEQGFKNIYKYLQENLDEIEKELE